MDTVLFYILTYASYAVYILIVFAIFKLFFTTSLKSYHSRWSTLLDNFSFSTQEFYKLLKQELNDQGITSVSILNVRLREGNAFSSKRSYLRVIWKDCQYDICGAPFGEGFFISWWLLYRNSVGAILISKIPFIGGWLARKLYPETYYKIDTASMFMTYCQQAVLKVIDQITSDKGSRQLSLDERKPIQNNVFKR